MTGILSEIVTYHLNCPIRLDDICQLRLDLAVPRQQFSSKARRIRAASDRTAVLSATAAPYIEKCSGEEFDGDHEGDKSESTKDDNECVKERCAG